MTHQKPSLRKYPTPVTDPKEMAGWMQRERAAYEQGYEAGVAAASAIGDELAAIAEAALLQDAVDREATNQQIAAWRELRGA